MNNKSFTVVFSVTDEAEFKEFAAVFTGAMNLGNDVGGAKVTGIGWCDAMTESDILRDYLERDGEDVDEILAEWFQ